MEIAKQNRCFWAGDDQNDVHHEQEPEKVIVLMCPEVIDACHKYDNKQRVSPDAVQDEEKLNENATEW